MTLRIAGLGDFPRPPSPLAPPPPSPSPSLPPRPRPRPLYTPSLHPPSPRSPTPSLHPPPPLPPPAYPLPPPHPLTAGLSTSKGRHTMHGLLLRVIAPMRVEACLRRNVDTDTAATNVSMSRDSSSNCRCATISLFLL